MHRADVLYLIVCYNGFVATNTTLMVLYLISFVPLLGCEDRHLHAHLESICSALKRSKVPFGAKLLIRSTVELIDSIEHVWQVSLPLHLAEHEFVGVAEVD